MWQYPRCVFAGLATLCFAIGVVDIGLLSRYINYSQRAEQIQQDHLVCVSCQRLQQTFSRDVQLSSSISRLSREMRDGVETCCAGNQDQMAIIIELIRRKQAIVRAPVTYDPANVTSGPVSVHKCYLPPTNHSTASGHGHEFPDHNLPLRLNSSGKDFFMEHAESVEVLPSGYMVLVSGFYHVYSSLEFTARDGKPCKDYPVRTWKQIVVRSRPNDRTHSGAILSSAHTCCDDCTWIKETSYTGGTFYLQAGDHLHTEVSGMGLISFHAKSSYFGLMAI
ncbi:hypothetical protein BsWGS_23954 [Bradybaena similaris]